ncbi:MAG: hypothetical protein QM704_06620 [Anaeromyxobacteraceae bacterium]
MDAHTEAQGAALPLPVAIAAGLGARTARAQLGALRAGRGDEG